VKSCVEPKYTYVDITIFTPLQVRKLISYVDAIVTYFSVRRIHNNKILLFITTNGAYLD